MTKADLLMWVRKHSPPLIGCPIKSNPSYCPADTLTAKYQTDYNRFNAVANAAEAKAALFSRVPPLTMKDVDDGMIEYNK